MKGIAVVYSANAPSSEETKAAIASEAHAVAFPACPSPEILSAALTAAKNKVYTDVPVSEENWTITMETAQAAQCLPQIILSSTDLELLKAIRSNNAAVRLRLCTNQAAEAATLLPAMITVAPGQLNNGIQRACRKMGVEIWLDAADSPTDAALKEAITWEVDFLAGVELPRAVSRLRDDGYYAARMLLCKYPVPTGLSLSLSGTRWKRGKHILVFKEAPLLIVKGGIIDRLFMNGIAGEYSLAPDGTVNIRVKGREGHGIFDGNYLATDGVECVRLNE